MKIIEAMKSIKRLREKHQGLVSKIKANAAILDRDKPTYEDQDATVAGWIQAAQDVSKEIASLRMAITRTNDKTDVTIELSGKSVTKPIAYWILRRRELISCDIEVFSALTDRGLTPVAYTDADGIGKVSNVRRFFSPTRRDEMLSALSEERHFIDSALEIVNATTDIIE